ncbi:unnamed protein product [Bursaphelenchus okinawaensis]|uniref:G-protein coupled receptors family 1 profile domain-containing protein n=1 Tax=Bursaphelenchus okinawaensis TaxID=465554 RepID=A0A811L5Q6_9BILA|nr:unnamed protein product [Bursaphelenchus okinawaensis]CAG9119944.1 unnamed protein product [Bursaphelenchus okinawaensis]
MSPEGMNEHNNSLEDLIFFHTIDIYIGLIGVFLNVLLLSVFFSKRAFFAKNKMLVVLALGDLSACLGTFLLGYTRKSIYQDELNNTPLPIQTAWSCTQKWFVWFRLWGAVIPSAAVLWIAIERLLAVFAPIFFRTHIVKNPTRSCVLVLTYALFITISAFFIAHSRRLLTVKNYCGRKASFSNTFSTYIYISAITGYTLALGLNCVTLLKLKQMHSKMKNRELQSHFRILRYMVLISLISTLAVIIPNALSLFGAFYGRVDIAVSETANWFGAVKSSVNILIYFVLKPDFQSRALKLLRLVPKSKASEYESQIVSKSSPELMQHSLLSN